MSAPAAAARPSSSHGPLRSPLLPASAAATTAAVAALPAKPIRPSTAPLSPTPLNANETAATTLPRCRLSRAVGPEAIIFGLPSLRDTPPGLARRALLTKKLRLCSFMFDSSEGEMVRVASLSVREQEADSRAREAKRLTLLEIINYYTAFRPVFGGDEYTAVFDMLSWNLLRPLPPSSFELHVYGNPRGACSVAGASFAFSPEDDAQQEDPNWPHLQIAYELLLRLVSFTPTSAQTAAQAPSADNPHPEPASTLQQLQRSHKLLYSTHLSRRFILSLLHNFSSEDLRERDYLKTILHRIYGSSMALRPFIRRNLQHLLLRAIYDDERQHGIAEMLEILGSIINGFAVPLKDAHVDTLLSKILLPLHKVTHLSLFHPQLSYCVIQFLEKDARLANLILVGLLKVWPVRNSRKEVLFLNELEELLERVPDLAEQRDVLHPDVIVAVVTRIVACMRSTHFQVSEKAIYMLNNNFLARLVFFGDTAPGWTDQRETIVPILVRAIYANTETPITNSLDTPSRTHTTNGTASTAATAGDGRPSLSRSVPSTTPDSSLGASRPESPASTHGHWNSTISELTQEVVRAARSFDPPLWYECEEEVRRQVQEATQRQTQQQRRANAKNKAAAAASAANAAANDTRQRRQDARPLDTTVNLNAAIAAVKASTKAHTSGKAWDS